MGSNDAIIEEIIWSYPTLAEKMRSLKYSISSSHGKDPTASAASVELPAEEQRRYKAIISAIGHTTEAYQDGAMRMLFIRAFYWDNTPVDAMILKKISCFNAQEYRQDFIEAVSQRLQLCSCSDCIYWRKLFIGKSGSDIHACLYQWTQGVFFLERVRFLQKKHFIAGLLAAVLALSLAVPALAVGDGNIDGGDGGGGMGEGSKQNYWNNEDGCRITVLKNGQEVYQMDWSNQPEAASVRRSFSPKNKLDYLHGSSLSVLVNQYKSTVLTVKMPTIVGGAGGNNIDAIRRHFTDAYTVKLISDGTGIPYDDLIGGEYKLLLEPIAYFVFKGVKWAMTATEAAYYDVTVDGQLRAWMKSLTHQNLPLSMFLEKSDTELHLDKWTGAKSGKQTNADIVRFLGMGIVSFKAAPPPVTPGEYDYEFHTDTDVIVSFPVSSSSEINPDDNAYVTLNIGGQTFRKAFICPAGGTQLIWISCQVSMRT